MTDAPPRTFDRSRLRLGVVLAVIAGALAFLVIKGLDNATTYFKNADEAVAQRQSLGTHRFRLQGTVVPGSVRQQGDTVARAHRSLREVGTRRSGPSEKAMHGLGESEEGRGRYLETT